MLPGFSLQERHQPASAGWCDHVSRYGTPRGWEKQCHPKIPAALQHHRNWILQWRDNEKHICPNPWLALLELWDCTKKVFSGKNMHMYWLKWVRSSTVTSYICIWYLLYWAWSEAKCVIAIMFKLMWSNYLLALPDNCRCHNWDIPECHHKFPPYTFQVSLHLQSERFLQGCTGKALIGSLLYSGTLIGQNAVLGVV